jgi:hypothetical protein
MEKAVCDKLNFTQTVSRGRNACPHDGVDQRGRPVEIKTIGTNRRYGYLQAGRMAEKKKWCKRLVMEFNGRLFDTDAHPNPGYALAQLLHSQVTAFNPGLKANDKSTRQNVNTEVLLECEIAETV